MKPYGRKNHHHNHIDAHPSKGFANWWEVEIDNVKSKKKERRDGVKIIERELYDIENND